MNAGSNHSLEFATLLASPATEFQNGTTTRPAARGTKNNRGSFSNISFASIAESGEDETETDAPDAQECDHGSCSVVRDEVEQHEEPDEECSLAGEEDYETREAARPRMASDTRAPRRRQVQEQEQHHDEFPHRNQHMARAEDATGYTTAVAEMKQAVEQQICHALQHVTNVSMRQRRSASSAQVSSDYWKGLLVGMFLVQAIFVPVWAAWAAGGGGGADSGIVFAFLQGSIWKLIVLIVSGVGFVVVALIAIQYDCALQDELQELRRLAATATAGSGTDSGDGAHTRTTGTRRHASGSRTGSRTSSTTVTPIASNPPAEQSTSGRALSERLTTRSTTRRVATQPQQETPPRSVPPAATVRWAAEGAAGQASVAPDPSSQRRRRRQQEQQPQRRQEQQPQQPRREEEPRSQRPQSQQNNSVVAQAVSVAPGENNSVSETVPSTASVHEEDQEPTEVVATPTRNNHEDVVRFEEEEKEPERDDCRGFDNRDKQEGDRPPSGMVVTSSHTIMPTQTTTSTSRQMSFNNRSMTMSLSSHTSQNMDHPTPATGGARDDDSLTAPTKEITCAQSTSQPSSFAPQSTPDFYPDATVLFAHISGFTAWSSERGPEQIFLLLEKLHRRFDDAARRLEITKVETTSESYQAVTGVPHEQPDHAEPSDLILGCCGFGLVCTVEA
ncbi:Receptor-type guanylate cyclase gcy [Seminavis robusta]|uniref:Receptor-type guanylate cyclase gcy n=1 Tax=Seminavis robusta TaxID=568900 RepID=A0A9N8EHX3_9STRA|nr:Receptor-type guanylate cyclase gcy [Seminavis robusta]|eukprot:Sro1161_g247780.1 Receptor-type guanylate cyclase gcy (674) ;mRNA; r:4244-6428